MGALLAEGLERTRVAITERKVRAATAAEIELQLVLVSELGVPPMMRWTAISFQAECHHPDAAASPQYVPDRMW